MPDLLRRALLLTIGVGAGLLLSLLLSNRADAFTVREVRALSVGEAPLSLQLRVAGIPDPALVPLRVSLATADEHRAQGLERPVWADALQVSLTFDDTELLVVATAPVPERDRRAPLLMAFAWGDQRWLQQVPVLRPDPAARPYQAEERLVIPMHQEQIRVRAGDTLSRLAEQWTASALSLVERMQVLFAANPDAFVDNNPDLLRRDARVRYPDATEWASLNTPLPSLAVETLNAAPVVSGAAPTTGQTLVLTVVGDDVVSGVDATGQDPRAVLEARRAALMTELASIDTELAALIDAPPTSESPEATVPPAETEAPKPPIAGHTLFSLIFLIGLVLFLLVMGLVQRVRSSVTAPRAAPVAPVAPVIRPVSVPEPDDEYDFTQASHAEAHQTRLDLAEAYLAMNEPERARDLLTAVLNGGTAEQQAEAAARLQQLASAE